MKSIYCIQQLWDTGFLDQSNFPQRGKGGSEIAVGEALMRENPDSSLNQAVKGERKSSN